MSGKGPGKAALQAPHKVACQDCNLFELCLPIGLQDEDLDRLDNIINRRKPLQRGSHLFEMDDRFECIYALRSGSIKTYTVTDDGREQITSFYLPGELLGLDAINAMKHPCSAMALETSSICEIPYSTFEDLGADLPGIHRTLTRIMSKELLQEQNLLSLLGKYTVEERVAAFLLNLSQRFEERGFSPREFNLSMSRHDIGNYLGMAVETVSRVFGRFQEDGLLSVQRRFIQLHDVPAIRNLCGCIGKHC